MTRVSGRAVPERDVLRAEILRLAEARGRGRTICPSEVARSLDPQDWRRLMQPVREAAFGLADERAVAILQRGKIVDGRTAEGPLRIGWVAG